MGHQALRDRIHSFDIRYSTFYGSAVRFLDHSFDIRYSIFFGSAVRFSPVLRSLDHVFSVIRFFNEPLNPEPLNPEPLNPEPLNL